MHLHFQSPQPHLCHTSSKNSLNCSDPTGTRTPNRLLRRQMLYPVELWDHVIARWQRVSSAKMWRFGHTTNDGNKKRDCVSAVPFPQPRRGECDQWPLERLEVLLPPLFLPFSDFLPVSAAAPLEQHPAEEDLLQDAPLLSVEAEAPLEQHPADLDLSQDAPLLSVEAEAPLEQQPADLDLSQVALLASLAQVCSVLAFLSAGASVDWADAVKAKMANAPRKRNFFIVLLSF